jgi:hypothetical protein
MFTNFYLKIFLKRCVIETTDCKETFVPLSIVTTTRTVLNSLFDTSIPLSILKVFWFCNQRIFTIYAMTFTFLMTFTLVRSTS